MRSILAAILCAIPFAAVAAPAGTGDASTRKLEKLHAVPASQVKLLPGEFADRAERNREYVVSLKNQNLLQNHYMEAGIWKPMFRLTGAADQRGDDIHWGWESPTCQLRGHFLGHWLSAAAQIAASSSDAEVKGKADTIVAELARVQEASGGQWAGSIPEKYLDWVVNGRPVWAPQYTVHKTFMGLVDMHKLTGNKEALEIADRWAGWFHAWTKDFSRDKMDDILDVETGGMLEVWADLYGITGKQVYLDLIEKYNRPRLFNRLLEGQDVLTNKHANTTIPEAHGAARAYEVTGDTRWRSIVAAYWKSAVTDRGYYATGGQTSGEIWTPPMKLGARLGDKNQEHCVVYNMIRLADYLFRWTGDVTYADYIERNIHNGILAQQNPQTGMVTYFLPLAPGSKKTWGSPTNDFWCCHGSLVQAQAQHNRYVYYNDDAGMLVAQYIPSQAAWQQSGTAVRLTQSFVRRADDHVVHTTVDPNERPTDWVVELKVAADKPADFTLRLRVPWWVKGKARLTIDGKDEAIDGRPSSYIALRRAWKGETLRLTLPKALTVSPLPDQPELVAFMDGPVVLAGLTDQEKTLYGDPQRPETILAPDNEREWSRWLPGYRTTGQETNIRFVPLSAVINQAYTVYFPVKSR